MKKVMGADHEVKSVTIFIDDDVGQYWLGEQKCFQKVAAEF